MLPSLFLSLCSKPSLRKLALVLRSSHTFGTRMFSSSTTNPYLMQYVTFCGEGVYSFFLEASKSNPKFIPMHPRDITNGCQDELVSGFAMSSSPDEQGCLTAVNYTGRLLSIGAPGLDIKGISIFAQASFFNYFDHSTIMYSKRDQKFYMASSGGHHLWSWGGLPSTNPQFHQLRFHNLPLFSHSELQLLDSCYRTQHLVESPSGQRFLVKWYAQSLPTNRMSMICGGTKRFMVFREEEDMSMSYTQDIGDLCMFLGSNEPFCLEASSFPGLKHNLVPHWEPHWLPPCPL